MQARGAIGLVVILTLAGLLAWQLGWLGDREEDEAPGDYGALEADAEEADGRRVGPHLSADGTRALPGKKPGVSAGGAAAFAGTAPPAPEPGPDRIVGVVTDAAGKPIAGAVVTLVPPDTALGVDGRWERSFRVTTDAHGQFVYEASEAGAYRMSVAAEGYFAVSVRASRGGRPLRLEMQVPVPLSGRLVERGSGEAIARFSLWATAESAGLTDRRYMAQTDDEGYFHFRLPAGEAYFLRYPASHFATSGVVGDWIPARWGPFASGREDLVLELERGLSIAGMVVDATGAKIGEVFRVEAIGRTARGDLDYSRRRFVDTDSKGAFRLPALPEGLYLVTAQPRRAAAEGSPQGLSKREIEGIAAGTQELVIELGRGEAMVGEILDEAGAPVAGKGYVHVYPQGSTAGSPGSVRGTLDGKGGFRTPPLDPGTAYDLLVAGFEGFSHARLEGVHAGAAVVRVTLTRGGTIRGRVVRADGKPVPVGMGVMATAIGVKAGTKGANAYSYPDALGIFTLNGLGDFEFRVAAGGAQSGLIAAATKDVRPGTTDLVLEVKPGVALSGRLLDSNGDPVKTHLLTAMPVGAAALTPAAWTSIPGEDGTFHFAGVHPGKLRMLAYVGETTVVVGEVTAPAKDVVLRVPGG